MRGRGTLVAGLLAVICAGLSAILWHRDGEAYVEAPMSLGAIIAQSTNIARLEVEKVDRRRNVIYFRKLKDIKGRHYTDNVIQQIGHAGFHEREWQNIMNWAKPGETAVFFHNGRASETCIDTYWYQCYGSGQNWRLTHAEPYLLRSFAGRPEQLGEVVEAVLRGEEPEAPCMVDGNKQDLALRRARIQRMRVSLNRQHYDPRRDFSGWGTNELQRLENMPGFSHLSPLPRVDPDAVGVSCADYDADGRLDFCLFGPARVVLVHGGEKTFEEVKLPVTGGARAAAWADHDGDGHLDLLLACPGGPRLLGGAGKKSSFRDHSRLLPSLDAWNVTSAAWLDADVDGWPDILVANGFYGLRLFRNPGGQTGRNRTFTRGKFRDAGRITYPPRLGVATKGDHLVVGDVNGDQRSDVLYCTGRGVLLLNRPEGFVPLEESGIDLGNRQSGPALGDFDRDGDLDLFVPSKSCGRLFENDGKGHFHEATSRAIGVVGRSWGTATSAAWGDIDADGWLDLVIARIQGPNQVLLSRGDGTFRDGSHLLGMRRRVFNSQAICLADVDDDGDLDFILANEAQDSCVLVSTLAAELKNPPVEIILRRRHDTVGARMRIVGLDGDVEQLELETEVGGLQARGCQYPPRTRLGLRPGTYRVEVRYSSGRTHRQQFRVEASPLRVEVGDA